jgi:hypothetical protein
MNETFPLAVVGDVHGDVGWLRTLVMSCARENVRYVLSAKHHLLHPDAVIDPYDMKLGVNHRTAPPIHQWAATVQAQLAAELAGLENVKLVVLAGEQYRYAVYNSPWEHEISMKGLGIGQQLGWQTARLSENERQARCDLVIVE